MRALVGAGGVEPLTNRLSVNGSGFTDRRQEQRPICNTVRAGFEPASSYERRFNRAVGLPVFLPDYGLLELGVRI